MADIFSGLSDNIYHYIDFVWLPVTFLVVHKGHRLLALAFVLTTLVTFRIQVELMEWTGYGTGFLPIMESSIFARGMVIYSVIIMFFLLLAHYSPNTKQIVFFAASLSIYILAFCLSMLLMIL